MSGLTFRLTLCGLLISEAALAGPVMDFIRSYDLNDYSLGVAVTATENPYVGGETSVFSYPYLTSFRDASFTRDWFLISEGDVGLRFVTKNDWELGVVGRVQTLGLGNSDAPELRGRYAPGLAGCRGCRHSLKRGREAVSPWRQMNCTIVVAPF